MHGGEAAPYREGIRQAIDWYRRGSAQEMMPGQGPHERPGPRLVLPEISLAKKDKLWNVPPLQQKEVEK